jgi:tRNA A37 methylthiotransferase MiaB
VRVLAEGEGRSGGGWLSGRTESNDIVEFTGPREAIGRFVNVKIERALNWALFGSLA